MVVSRRKRSQMVANDCKCLPLYSSGRYIALLFTSHLFITSVLCLCVLSVYHAGGQTRDVDPMSGYCWPTVYDAEQTLTQYWVTVSYLTPRLMWASATDGGPTLTQPCMASSSSYCTAGARPISIALKV